jgi:hypothetical protein
MLIYIVALLVFGIKTITTHLFDSQQLLVASGRVFQIGLQMSTVSVQPKVCEDDETLATNPGCHLFQNTH